MYMWHLHYYVSSDRKPMKTIKGRGLTLSSSRPGIGWSRFQSSMPRRLMTALCVNNKTNNGMKSIIKILLVLLIISPAYAQSQEPSPSPFKNIQEPKAKAKEIYNKTDSNQRGTDKSPIVVKIIPADTANIQIQNEAQNTSRKSFYDKLVAWSTVALAIITAILAFYTYRLWSATKKTAKRQLRAYVFMKLEDGVKMFYDANGCLNAPLIIKNFGQTPAYEFISWLHIGFYKFPLDIPLDQPSYVPTASKSTIAPGDIVRQYVTLPDRLNNAEIEAIQNKKAAIFVCGEVIYFDAFKTKQRSNICLYATGNDFSRGELAYYHEGNYAT